MAEKGDSFLIGQNVSKSGANQVLWGLQLVYFLVFSFKKKREYEMRNIKLGTKSKLYLAWGKPQPIINLKKLTNITMMKSRKIAYYY